MTEKQHIERYILAAFLVCVFIVVALSALLITQYHHLRGVPHHTRGPVGVADVSLIQSWMTFDYINHVFALPPAYLKNSLNINDSRYPRMTIREAAEDDHISAPEMLTQTEDSVRTSISNPTHP